MTQHVKRSLLMRISGKSNIVFWLFLSKFESEFNQKLKIQSQWMLQCYKTLTWLYFTGLNKADTLLQEFLPFLIFLVGSWRFQRGFWMFYCSVSVVTSKYLVFSSNFWWKSYKVMNNSNRLLFFAFLRFGFLCRFQYFQLESN
jgi:hypothetical protein